MERMFYGHTVYNCNEPIGEYYLDRNRQIMYSSKLSEIQIRSLGGDKNKVLSWIDKQHLPFLEWHRGKVFEK